jgi:two-component system LytT family sensor kinase
MRIPWPGSSIQTMRDDRAAALSDTPPRIRWRVVVALFGIATIARFAYFYLDDLTRQLPGTLFHRVIEEGTGNFASLVFFPISIVLERRFPLDRGRWRRNWLPHVGGLVVYSIAHTTLIAALRAVLFPLFGHGSYDYGIMSVRYFMEASQDLFSYATFVGVLTLLRVQMRLSEREVRAAELERDAANARLEALSLRLQPHFLFNALNTISAAVYDDPAAADDLIGRLGDLLRRSLQTADHPEISLVDELEILAAYRALIEARFGDRVRFSVDIAGDTKQLAVPSFLLQPLVENAVRHGMTREFGDIDILVSANANRGVLRLIVENETDATDAPTRLGTGLGATRDRLRLLYGADSSLETSIVDGRFRVTVMIPAHEVPIATAEELPARAHR